MPDIAMCANSACPSRMQCHRFTAVPSEFRQAYGTFKPAVGFDKCDRFWDNTHERKAEVSHEA